MNTNLDHSKDFSTAFTLLQHTLLTSFKSLYQTLKNIYHIISPHNRDPKVQFTFAPRVLSSEFSLFITERTNLIYHKVSSHFFEKTLGEGVVVVYHY